MARERRVDYPGAWHHVMNRGARREPIFVVPEHCTIFLHYVGEIVRRYGLEVHAYALMPNHFHLLVRSVKGNLSRAMQFLLGKYTQHLNSIYQWDGPVFRGRFKSQLVNEGEHLQVLVPYIHLNPVKANIVVNALEAIWTSYPAYLGESSPEDWLTTDRILSLFGGAGALREETAAYSRGELTWDRDFDTTDGTFRSITVDDEVALVGRAARVAEQVAFVGGLVKTVSGYEWGVAVRGATGRRGNPVRRLAIWLLATRTDLTHREIADSVDTTAKGVSNTLGRMRKGSVEKPLKGWIESVHLLLDEA